MIHHRSRAWRRHKTVVAELRFQKRAAENHSPKSEMDPKYDWPVRRMKTYFKRMNGVLAQNDDWGVS